MEEDYYKKLEEMKEGQIGFQRRKNFSSSKDHDKRSKWAVISQRILWVNIIVSLIMWSSYSFLDGLGAFGYGDTIDFLSYAWWIWLVFCVPFLFLISLVTGIIGRKTIVIIFSVIGLLLIIYVILVILADWATNM